RTRRPRLPEGPARLGLDEVARVALLDDAGERVARGDVVDELAEGAHDHAAGARVALAAERADQDVACGRRADRTEAERRRATHGPELVLVERRGEGALG